MASRRERTLGRDHPDTLWSVNNTAWFLATVPETELRDHERAVVLGERTTATDPSNGYFWCTLATARYRVGDYRGAIAALETSMKVIGTDDAINDTNAIVLAMAHASLGNPDQAQAWLDKGYRWLDEYQQNDPSVLRLLDEAQALIR